MANQIRSTAAMQRSTRQLTRFLATTYLINAAAGAGIAFACFAVVLLPVRALAFWLFLPPDIWLSATFQSYWQSLLFAYPPTALVAGSMYGLYALTQALLSTSDSVN